MSKTTKLIANAVHAGKHLGSALRHVAERHKESASNDLASSHNFMSVIENETGLGMQELKAPLEEAMHMLKAKPVDWEAVKQKIEQVLSMFKQKL